MVPSRTRCSAPTITSPPRCRYRDNQPWSWHRGAVAAPLASDAEAHRRRSPAAEKGGLPLAHPDALPRTLIAFKTLKPLAHPSLGECRRECVSKVPCASPLLPPPPAADASARKDMRSRHEPGVAYPSPVREVVSRLMSARSVVRDFVHIVSASRQLLANRRVHRG